jgi:uncharacterized protein (DUF302 family)
MKYIVETQKTIEQAATDLAQAVTDNKFGVLHIYDLKKTLNSKGVEFENECRVFEICNPVKAKEVMTEDMDMNMALPCRISVYQKGGKTLIGMIKPKDMLSALSDSKKLHDIAEEVENTMYKIIDQAV